MMLTQPELGRRLTVLRKEKNMTQEDLAGQSHVSVRTIQRIEAGEVLPRASTVKILLGTLGQTYESFKSNEPSTMNTSLSSPTNKSRNTLLIAVFAGAIYLVVEIILSVMDVIWLTDENKWPHWLDLVYISLTIVMMISYILFAGGFIVLSNIFENKLLKAASLMMILVVISVGALDIITLSMKDNEFILIPYIGAAVLSGAAMIVFGVGLIRLQDGVGELARAAGMLEIVAGCSLVSVFLFFIGYIILVPAVIVEILVLYKGYEYLSLSEKPQANVAAS